MEGRSARFWASSKSGRSIGERVVDQGASAGEPLEGGTTRKASPEIREEKIRRRRETVWAARARGGISVWGPEARAASAWRVRSAS